MYTVSGKVLVKESGVGIPNLQVVVYDLDPQTSSPNFPNRPDEWFEVPEGGKSLFWQRIPGERLGSALTGEGGEFILRFEADQFSAQEAVQRPDLVLFVMAPEDSDPDREQKQVYFPRPANQRILHYSYDPLVNSGRNESYVIRISEKILEKFDLFPAGKSGAAVNSATFVQTLQESSKLITAGESFKKPLVQERAKKGKEVKAKARQVFAGLGGKPVTNRNDWRFAGQKGQEGEYERVTAAQTMTVREGLNRLKGYSKHSGLGTTLYLTDHHIEDLVEREIITPGPEDLKFTINDTCSLLNATVNTPALERVRNLIDEQARGTASAAPVIATGGSIVTGNGHHPATEETAPATDRMDSIKDQTLAQVSALTPPVLGNGSGGVMENLQKMLNQMKSADSGPSDVAALHDFHFLQLAFEHVWMEAFDERLRSGAEDLFAATVRLHEDYGVEMPPIEAIQDINDYRRFLADVKESSGYTVVSPIPTEVHAILPDLSYSTWNALSFGQQWQLEQQARNSSPPLSSEIKFLLDQVISNPQGEFGRVQRLILELEKEILEPYAFHYFAPNSYNFGLLTTVRQKWTPETYQVGDLVATVPLAPGETRKIAVRQVVNTSRATKEIEQALSSRSEESRHGGRAEKEIVNRAQTTTNFQQTAQGSLNFGIGSIGGSTLFGLNQAQESAQMKKTVDEAVQRASYEYRSEKSLEVETSDGRRVEGTSSGEMSNTNNEITVTYLFYELERRFRVSTRLHRLTPVILVAQDIPAPHEIDDAWMLANAWILRRVLLDDSLQPALDVLSDGFVGAEMALEIKLANWRALYNEHGKLEKTTDSWLARRDSIHSALVDLTRSRDRARAGEIDDGQRAALAIATGGLSELFGFGGPNPAELLEAERKAMEMNLENAGEMVAEWQSKLARAGEVLNQATSTCTRAMEDQHNKRTQVDQLRAHIKANILYYMQAIWDYEPPDQRFFRLYHLEVRLPQPASELCTLRPATPEELARGVPGLTEVGGRMYIAECGPPAPADPMLTETLTLGEIADTDRPLGYKGNYMIFPLKVCTALTEFMMQEYIDSYFGLRDPDLGGNYTAEEVLAYAEAVRAGLPEGDPLIPILDRWVAEALMHSREEETVIVPTGQLFIEALPGEHPVLEKFKQLHRGLDVAKVEAELRLANLESLRRAALVVNEALGDPDVERKTVISGDVDGIIVPPEA